MSVSKNAVLIVLLISAVLVAGASAVSRDATLSPGPLDPDHGDASCPDCHEAWSGVPDGKCLDCHGDDGDPGSAVGTHHRELGGSCVDCHPEHRGGSQEALLGGHKSPGANCTVCHADALETAYPEGNHWTGGCGICHSTRDWHEIVFRHDGHFPLRSEGHWRAGCSSCHPDSRDGSFDDASCSGPRFCHRPGTYLRWARLDDVRGWD